MAALFTNERKNLSFSDSALSALADSGLNQDCQLLRGFSVAVTLPRVQSLKNQFRRQIFVPLNPFSNVEYIN